MKLEDLKSGMAIQMKNGRKYLIVGFGNELAFLCETGQTLIPEVFITDDLECISDYKTLNDIIIVYKLPPCAFQDFPKFCCKEYIIWERKENKNPFKSVKIDEDYFAVNSFGKVNRYFNFKEYIGKELNLIANCYANEDFAIKQAKEEVLNRLLKRFSYENGWNDDLWGTDNLKCYITYDTIHNEWTTLNGLRYKHSSVVYFISDDIAQRAIDEIVIPFYNNELEVCKIWEE